VTRAALAFRIHRFEAVALALVGGAAFAFAGGLLVRLLAFDLPLSCFLSAHSGDGMDSGCAGRSDYGDYVALASDLGMYAVLALALLPFFVGLVLGVAVVGKEIERGTIALAWSVGPSRRRWLLGVVAPVLVAAVGVSLVAGLLADRLELARDPAIDPSSSLHHLGLRGVVLPAYALASFGIALALGARLGRVLPALLLAGALSLGAVLGTTAIVDTMLRSEAIAIDESRMMEVRAFATGRVFDSLIRTPEGALISWFEAEARYGPTFWEHVDPGSPGYDPSAGFGSAYLVTPGQLYPIAEWRMAVILGALGLAGIVVAAAIVERRRPA
jgi:ABC-type transport system involved in multi-copper enzyme maturation permease subunit